MIEHPMIFQPESVRGLLAKPPTKWQTRRVVTAHNSRFADMARNKGTPRKCWPSMRLDRAESIDGVGWSIPCTSCMLNHFVCPRYAVGDLIRVRETWAPPYGGWSTCYLADCEVDGKPCKPKHVPHRPDTERWRSPLYMPRDASRAWLRVCKVRGQRLQDISEEDAKAEGARLLYWYAPTADEDTHITLSGANASHLNGFATQWTSINRKKPGRRWEDNPIVWAYSVDRVLNRAEADEYLREAA